jgi:hypothetical protein
MWQMTSADAAAQFLGTHSAGGRVDILHSGRSVQSLVVTDGSVDAQANRPVTRNLTCTIADETGVLSGSDIGDLLSPYDAEVAAFRGVMASTGVIEWVPNGVYGITDKAVGDFGAVQLTGQDRAMIYQGSMTGSLAINGGTPIETAIRKLLLTRNAGLQFTTYATGYTCGPLLYDPDIDVWKEALDLAQAAGGWLAHNRVGSLIFAPSLPPSKTPVRRFARGDGLLIAVDRGEGADTIHNVVVIESTKTNNGTVIRGIAEDTDPTSPTYSRGRYGRRVVTYTNQHVSSQRQAVDVATTQLVRELGRTETVSITAVVDPRLDPLDVVVVHHPEKFLVERPMVLEGVTIPLTVKNSMGISFRKSVISQNGHILDTPSQVTTS